MIFQFLTLRLLRSFLPSSLLADVPVFRNLRVLFLAPAFSCLGFPLIVRFLCFLLRNF